MFSTSNVPFDIFLENKKVRGGTQSRRTSYNPLLKDAKSIYNTGNIPSNVICNRSHRLLVFFFLFHGKRAHIFTLLILTGIASNLVWCRVHQEQEKHRQSLDFLVPFFIQYLLDCKQSNVFFFDQHLCLCFLKKLVKGDNFTFLSFLVQRRLFCSDTSDWAGI